MITPSAAAVRRFSRLQERLALRAPESIEIAERIAGQIVDPTLADANRIWPAIWTKPLFAFTNRHAGRAAIERLNTCGEGMAGAWRSWGLDPKRHVWIHRTGRGRANVDFVLNDAAREVRRQTGIAAYRLMTIQGAAVALRVRRAKRGMGRAPYRDLPGRELGQAVAMLRAELGFGWGQITVLHLLTDLGIACKPDRHVVRTVAALEPRLGLKPSRQPTDAETLRINAWVRGLTVALHGAPTRHDLRRTDVLLMHLSLEGLLPDTEPARVRTPVNRDGCRS